MKKPDPYSGNALYTFNEVITMITECESKQHLKVIEMTVSDDKKEYSIFHYCLIQHAIKIRFPI